MGRLTTSAPARSVLYISHCAQRNGAAMVLLHLLRWSKANSKRPFSLLLAQGGELLSELSDCAPTWAADNSRWCPGGLRSQVMKAIGLESVAQRAENVDLRRFVMRYRPALIYLNGFAQCNFRLAESLNLNVPMLTHVHGLGLAFQTEAGSAMTRIFSATSRLVACSLAVKQNLVSQYEVPANRIEVVHESISVRSVQAEKSRRDILQELGFPEDSLVVVGCGPAAWNKGADIFLHVTRLVCRQCSTARFVWLGGDASWSISQLQHDAYVMGITEKMRFTGLVQDPHDYLSAADVFALTSREDSFPLACLEAAAMSKPIICFKDAGGMPEFVENDCGFVVPYLDIEAMVQRIVGLLKCPDFKSRMGEAARRKVIERHDISVAAPRIAEIIERTITESSPMAYKG